MESSVSLNLYDLDQKLSGLVSLLDYRYCNICVKATPVSLLPIKITIDGNDYQFEDVAGVLMDEDNPFVMQIYPKDEQNILLVGKGIALSHPEFKQEIKTMTLEGEEGEEAEEVRYILLTMPEVNEDRKKVMTESVKLLYNDCKARMKACLTLATANVMAELLGREADVIDEAKKALEDKHDQYLKMCDSLNDDKNQEIQDAYNDFLSRQAAEKQKSAIAKDENDPSLITSLKL